VCTGLLLNQQLGANLSDSLTTLDKLG